MEPKEKRRLERKETSQKRRTEVIQAARRVFDRMGIENTKMTDVAAEAEIGVATVYRYFNTKAELAIEVGIDFIHEINEFFQPDFTGAPRGLDKTRLLIDKLIDLYHQQPEFVRFLQSFDFFFASNDKDHPRLRDFETEISTLFPPFYDALAVGRRDGSICIEQARDDDIVALILRSIISMEQRFLTRDYILDIDRKMDRDFELQVLKEMILDYLARDRSITNG